MSLEAAPASAGPAAAKAARREKVRMASASDGLGQGRRGRRL
eukprot:CAMPEP_0197894050 /NCGR_PEP_ID=MMETSP1439-20131203/34285_1 /TAXON_ID=66791 /ORGANISM="Gonyaulax spinifera, Strain CCMP409" /LENGTH=41 /DNA_ID= /DNA_START= /DNA_END= /DNA_ORIENTATION=